MFQLIGVKISQVELQSVNKVDIYKTIIEKINATFIITQMLKFGKSGAIVDIKIELQSKVKV